MIRKAIQEIMLLEFDYQGFHRIVEPHVYGQKFGKDGMMVYQIRGKSSTGYFGWKRMYLKEITNMKILDETFSGRRIVSGRHSSWDTIYLVVRWLKENYS